MAIGKYIKAAFLNRWNILAFAGGLALAAVSGYAGVVAPLVLAGEVAYLGLLGTHSKFQRYVDAQRAKTQRMAASETQEQMVENILRTVPRDARERYEKLRERCLRLRQIAKQIKRPGVTDPGTLESLQVRGLDRLLWVFLRLLYTKYALAHFLKETDGDAIPQEIAKLEKRLASMDENPTSGIKQKIRRTVEDNLATNRARLENFNKAHGNFQFVNLELDRLENKIKSLAEVAVNRQEPDYISSQIDHVAESILETEQTIHELDFATGLGESEHQVPELLKPMVTATVVDE